jgi:hypothetical protein
MTGNALIPPFPWFGGKRQFADVVWRALGDPRIYIEPFAGGAAVLLARPQYRGRRYEIINDADGWLINTWRSIRLSPDAVVEHAFGPKSDVDYHARLAWLKERRTQDLISWLEGDPEAHDPKAAGWWLYVTCNMIGSNWGPGPWQVVDGRLCDTRTLPHWDGEGSRGISRSSIEIYNQRGIHRVEFQGEDGKERLLSYMQALAKRLINVTLKCGDWRSVLAPSLKTQTTLGSVGIFFDPPYAETMDGMYAAGDADVAVCVRKWCMTEASPEWRIVLCGYGDEHDELLEHGWRVMKPADRIRSGWTKDHQSALRERMWLSPSCLVHEQMSLIEQWATGRA